MFTYDFWVKGSDNDAGSIDGGNAVVVVTEKKVQLRCSIEGAMRCWW